MIKILKETGLGALIIMFYTCVLTVVFGCIILCFLFPYISVISLSLLTARTLGKAMMTL